MHNIDSETVQSKIFSCLGINIINFAAGHNGFALIPFGTLTQIYVIYVI